MKSKWVIHKLNTYLPFCPNSLRSPFKTEILGNLTSKTSTFVLDHVDISVLLSLCSREGYLHLGSSLHASIVKNHEFDLHDHSGSRNAVVIWNSILSMYSKCGVLVDAVKLFEEIPKRDTVSWNTIISGFLRHGDMSVGFSFFKQMQHLGIYRLDQATLTTTLSACDRTEFIHISKMLHGLAFSIGLEWEITVGNALITSYFRCGCYGSGRQVFDEMLERNVVTWTAIMSGLARNKLYEDSLRMLVKMRRQLVKPNLLTYLSSLVACSGLQALMGGRQIHGLVCKLGIESEMCVESALMDMYAKCGIVEDAWQIFECAEEFDEVSMTVILTGFVQNGFEEQAVHMFVKIMKAGYEIDPNMVSAVLGVFGEDNSLALGKQIHSLIVKRSFGSNVFVGNGLINMYSKCGDIDESVKIFNRMQRRNLVSWNSMIATFACHGVGIRALQLYEVMRLERVEPTDVTFLSLLHACSHVGLVDKGMEFLKSMTEVYGIRPRSEHYSCVVDMLGRAGHLSEAKNFIEGLPVKSDALVWQALLGACSVYGNAEIGKYAAEKLFLLEPGKPAPYILLANMYSSEGRWKERARTIKRMKEARVAKETGISWIEIENKVHKFVVGDRMHPQSEIINLVLAKLFEPMRDEGYEPEKRLLKYYLDEGYDSNASLQRKNLYAYHFPSYSHPKYPLSSSSLPYSDNCTSVHCRKRNGECSPLSTSSAYMVLGVHPGCSAAELKAAFRVKVKKFHPDLNRDRENSDEMIRRVIQAYEMLSGHTRPEIIESECLDPFDKPECEAFDIFVNEVRCLGKGCPYSCIERAPHAFKYASSTDTARAKSQGMHEDYQVQVAVGQCPRNCIHYVTPSQRIILEELLESVLMAPYDTSAEANLLYSLITKARFENNRFQKPKKQPKTSSKHVDWF
ncbi:hypothetical protein K2173_027192 [Erythroxylum novogranatense]|uniref:J domain-containing protein n=1 Tax=Erythroxylum novogranatense TaxID=1862640 RepID=A0AAV8TYI2_9ROSI|nr:hypothetical protein K2173_027192 [Erythroxylum novogranatense]